MTGRVFLLHGFTGAPASFDRLSPMLSAESRSLALLGHGAPAPEVSSFDGEVDRLAAVITGLADTMPRGKRWVVGYSLGGRLALGLAARHPEFIDGVVAVGAHPGLADTAAREERRRADAELAADILNGGVHRFVDAWEQAPLFRSQRELPAALLASQRRVRLIHRPEGLARSLRVLGLGAMGDLRPALGRSSVPVHLVTGAFDEKFSNLARGFSDAASHTVVDGAGHNVLLEKPEALADVVNALTRDQASPPRSVEARP